MVLKSFGDKYMAAWPQGLGLMTLWLGLMMLAGGRLQAAGSTEDRAYDRLRNASSNLHVWDRVETDAANFIKNYPTSEHFGDVVMIQAQAMSKQHKYAGMIDLLSTPQVQSAKGIADQAVYWTAEAQYYLTNYHDAADTFARLVKDYTNSTRRLDAVVEEADARSRMGDWKSITNKLGQPEGVFQQMARTNLPDQRVVRGIFILTEAELAQKDFGAAEQSLQDLG